METIKYITKQEFIDKFKYNHKLLTKDKKVMFLWQDYCKAVRKLRSDSIKELRQMGVDGKTRSKYNNYIQNLSKPSHKKYLYFKDPICKICFFSIRSLREATIDHIIPTSKDGPNVLKNKQIAHGPCNVKKSNKLEFKYKKAVY